MLGRGAAARYADRMAGLDRAAELLRDRRKVVVFTGAGVPTDSGIPDFRSPGGVWTGYDPRHHTETFSASVARRSDLLIPGQHLTNVFGQVEALPMSAVCEEAAAWWRIRACRVMIAATTTTAAATRAVIVQPTRSTAVAPKAVPRLPPAK
jgi:hypothetical protein